MKTMDGDFEQMTAESAKDRADHSELKKQLEWLLAHDGAMRIPVASRRLIDDGVDPMVVAKTMLVGDRDGGVMYRLSASAHLAAMGAHEKVAERLFAVAMTDVDAAVVLHMLTTGAVWIATQFGIDRSMLAALSRAAERRAFSIATRPTLSPAPPGYGAVDIIDLFGVKDRAWLVEAVEIAQHPAYAPLEYKPS